MKWLSVFLFLSTLAFFSQAETKEHLPTAPETQGRPQAEPGSPFQQCEQTVLGIYPKYFGRVGTTTTHFWPSR
ncbi:MAG: hypothetical protein EBX50_19585 [Chitinophagia bacterium]|nr:hypothetical protein [Chitinophagia bacterium]